MLKIAAFTVRINAPFGLYFLYVIHFVADPLEARRVLEPVPGNAGRIW
jgi:hypothetical protein